MILSRTYQALLAPLLVTTFAVAVTHVPDAVAFEREDIVCELKELTRLISLRVDPDAGYVCDVLYEKPDEGGIREVLWSARNSVDYCKPRFVGFVESLTSRGWACDYADDPVNSDEQPSIGAAQDERSDDDESTSEGTTGKVRDWCIADVASGESVEGSGSVKSYCNCVAYGMDSEGLSEEDAKVIFKGLSEISAGQGGETSVSDKRLNTLSANYQSVAESCR